MASTLMVSIFLPKTVSFTEPPKKDVGRIQPFSPHQHQRANSALVLPSHASELSLFEKFTPATTPSAIKEFFLDVVETQTQTVPGGGDLRSSMPSESYATDWGANSIYNQPRSRVSQLPSDSIIAFENYLERKSYHAERYPLRFLHNTADGPNVKSFESRTASSERGYDGREWKIAPAIHGNGGLINAMRSEADGEIDPDATWIGTIGFPVDSLSEQMRDEIKDELQNEHQSKVVYCCDKDIDGHYKHYCKVVLWPIFHYQVPDHAKSKAYEDHSWEYYANVNQVFADNVIASYKKGDTIWIHDYHLLLVPRMVRDKLPDAKIGFFLHTAFPSAEVFRCLARKKELLHGMLGADLIGFQCREYTDHFLSTCAQILLVETVSNGVQLEHYFVNVTHQAIGINPALFEIARKKDEVKFWISELSEKYKNKRIIVARDKLDNVHGVRQKLLAYETFLRNNPEMRDKVVMIQIATSATEQSELLVTVSDIVSRVDSLYSTLSHQPLIFLRQDLTISAYLALLSIADVLMISSLREGMCLTAHDFVFCQDGQLAPKKYGAIILSEFTGSAAVFEDRFDQMTVPTHISINPWDNYGMAKAIRTALDMTEEEKEAHWRRLYNVVINQTGAHWAKELQLELDAVYEEHHQHASMAVPRLRVPQLVKKYTESERRVFILDYEGTLSPHRSSSGLQTGSPRRMLETLSGLLLDPNNIVFVMSSRRPEELENAFRTLPDIGLIAENGGYIRPFGSSPEWDMIVDEERVTEWKAQVNPILEYYRERLEGSTIEERRCSILFRYDKCGDQENATRLASECAVQINGADQVLRIRAVPVNKAVLIEMEAFSKGTAAASILKQARSKDEKLSRPLDFLFVAGDDREDEVVFRLANGLGKAGEVANVFTVTVGRRNTQAQATLDQGATSLLNVLEKLAKASANTALRFRQFYQPSSIPRNRTFPA